MFSGQDTRRLVPEETSFEPQTNIIDNELTAIISENNDILAFSEEPYNDQNSVYLKCLMIVVFLKIPF